MGFYTHWRDGLIIGTSGRRLDRCDASPEYLSYAKIRGGSDVFGDSSDWKTFPSTS